MVRCPVGEAAVVVLWLSRWNKERPRARSRRNRQVALPGFVPDDAFAVDPGGVVNVAGTGSSSDRRANLDPGLPFPQTCDGLIKSSQQNRLKGLVGTVPYTKPDHLWWGPLHEEESEEAAIFRHHNSLCRFGLGEVLPVFCIPEAQIPDRHGLDVRPLRHDPRSQGWRELGIKPEDHATSTG